MEQKSLWNTAIIRQALIDAFRKLDPRWMVKNPVMFVVEVGSVLTTALLIDNTIHHRVCIRIQSPDHALALVHRAVCQLRRGHGRRPRQGAGRHPAQGQGRNHRASATPLRELSKQVASGLLRAGDIIYVPAGHYIAGDGEVIEGVASVDESAITGESAPVIREAAATGLPSPAERKCCLTGSRSASPPIPAKPFWTA